jgi:hypothetical protein
VRNVLQQQQRILPPLLSFSLENGAYNESDEEDREQPAPGLASLNFFFIVLQK